MFFGGVGSSTPISTKKATKFKEKGQRPKAKGKTRNGARKQILSQSSRGEADSPKCRPSMSAGIPDSELAFRATFNRGNFNFITGSIAATALDFPADPVTPIIYGLDRRRTIRAQNFSQNKANQ